MGKRIRHPKREVVPQSFDYKIGDSVVVKAGVKYPDFGGDIGGWQGRVTEIKSYQPGKVTVTFQWDSLSLKRMPASAIQRCEEKGLDWTTMGLYSEEVERAEPCDTQDDVDAVIEELSAEHSWDYLGEQGRRIHQVLREVDEDDEMDAFAAWSGYLEEGLSFPFDAEISESQEHGPLQAGEHVTVTGIEGVEDLYGVLVNVKVGRKRYVFPLCDLDATDEISPNYQLVDDYAVWFANRK